MGKHSKSEPQAQTPQQKADEFDQFQQELIDYTANQPTDYPALRAHEAKKGK